MDKYIYKDTLNLAIKVSIILTLLFIIMGTIKSFANSNDDYNLYYSNDNNFKYRFKQIYLSGFGSVVSFSTLFHKNSNYLKYKSGCGTLPLYDSTGNQIQDLLGNNIYSLCDVIYEYDNLGTVIGAEHLSDKMKLNIEGGNMWGFALGINTHSAFRTEISYNATFKNIKNNGSIKGHGYALSKLDNNDYHIDFKSRSLFINTYFDILLDRRVSPVFVPYMMIGGGLSDNKISVQYVATTNSTILIPEAKSFKIAFTGGIGFSSSVTNYIVLDVSARYYNFGKIDTENYYIQNNTKNKFNGLTGKIGESYQIVVGLRFQI